MKNQTQGLSVVKSCQLLDSFIFTTLFPLLYLQSLRSILFVKKSSCRTLQLALKAKSIRQSITNWSIYRGTRLKPIVTRYLAFFLLLAETQQISLSISTTIAVYPALL